MGCTAIAAAKKVSIGSFQFADQVPFKVEQARKYKASATQVLAGTHHEVPQILSQVLHVDVLGPSFSASSGS